MNFREGYGEQDDNSTKTLPRVSCGCEREILHQLKYGSFLKWRIPNSWMVQFRENPNLKWMITGGTPMTWETTLYGLSPYLIPCFTVFQTYRTVAKWCRISPTSTVNMPLGHWAMLIGWISDNQTWTRTIPPHDDFPRWELAVRGYPSHVWNGKCFHGHFLEGFLKFAIGMG